MKKTIFLLIIWLLAIVACKKENNPTDIGTLTYASKTYKTIIINGKEWMAENLAYLPAVAPPSVGSDTSPYYYVYGYNGTDIAVAKATANYTTYGVLYNWPAAKAACPPGWHLPSDSEWKQLEIALGMTQVQADGTDWRGTDQGTQMKAPSSWNNNGNGTNTSNFAALPAGDRYGNGAFSGIGYGGVWWSSTESSTDYAWDRYMYYGNSEVGRSNNVKEDGFSVRCVRD